MRSWPSVFFFGFSSEKWRYLFINHSVAGLERIIVLSQNYVSLNARKIIAGNDRAEMFLGFLLMNSYRINWRFSSKIANAFDKVMWQTGTKRRRAFDPSICFFCLVRHLAPDRSLVTPSQLVACWNPRYCNTRFVSTATLKSFSYNVPKAEMKLGQFSSGSVNKRFMATT